MKKLLLTLAALPAATMAVEASAQTYANPNASVNIQNRIANLEMRLNAGVQAGAFSNNEYASLSNQLMQLRSLERQYSMNGLTTSERRQLQNRIKSVRDTMRMAGGNGWANRYGWSDRELDAYGNAYGTGYGNAYGNTNVRVDQYGRPIDQYGRVIANNGYRVDQYGRPVDQYGRVVANNGYRVDQYGRTVDQYGRVVSNGYNGQGGPYEPVYTPRSSNGGIGDVIGSVLGGGGGGLLGGLLGGRSLGVGDIITSAIGSVLRGGSSYGSQYRDNNRTYFRSDGQRVYEIDARTNQVIRIHPLQ